MAHSDRGFGDFIQNARRCVEHQARMRNRKSIVARKRIDLESHDDLITMSLVKKYYENAIKKPLEKEANKLQKGKLKRLDLTFFKQDMHTRLACFGVKR